MSDRMEFHFLDIITRTVKPGKNSWTRSPLKPAHIHWNGNRHSPAEVYSAIKPNRENPIKQIKLAWGRT